MQQHPWIINAQEQARWSAPLRLCALNELLDEAVQRWPQQPALRFHAAAGSHTLGYAQLGQAVDRLAAGLQQLGVGPGVHVGLYLPNTAHFPIGFFAILKAGGTVVNYSPLDAGQVLCHKIEDSATDIMLTLDDPQLLPRMQQLLDSTRLRALVVGSAHDFSTPNAGSGATGAATDARHHAFAQLLRCEAPLQLHAPGDVTTALAVLQYTGGTTGQPKGAMLTHANLSAAVAQVGHALLTPGTIRLGSERFLAVLPPFHIYALVINMLFGLSAGAEIVLHERFDAQAVLDEIERSAITVFLGVPTMYVGFTSHPGIESLNLRSLKFCNSGGAPIAAQVYQQFVQLTGCRLQEGWGMTESCTTATASPPSRDYRAGACGTPVAGVEVKVIDLQHQGDLEPGEHGELCIRGPNVMAGYWRQPAATQEAFTSDGFLRTGDVGYMTDDGFVYIVDRTKDMLICGGFNVYPRNIEEAIYRHPDVEEVIVIGIPDAYRGQSPKAFIKFKAGRTPLSLAQLKLFLADYLGKHEMLQAMEARAELPKTAVGKLSKKELYAQEQQAAAG